MSSLSANPGVSWWGHWEDGRALGCMVKDPQLLRTLEDDLARSQAPDYLRNLRIFEALYQEARLLGILPLQDPLDGIDVDIRLAAILNVRMST